MRLRAKLLMQFYVMQYQIPAHLALVLVNEENYFFGIKTAFE